MAGPFAAAFLWYPSIADHELRYALPAQRAPLTRRKVRAFAYLERRHGTVLIFLKIPTKFVKNFLYSVETPFFRAPLCLHAIIIRSSQCFWNP